MFTDCSQNRLIICNADGTDIHHIPLPYEPFYISEVDSNTVAVSCRNNRTILMINISTCSVISTINTCHNCYGLSYDDDILYVVIDMSIIHVMNLTGKVMRTINLPSDDIRDITVDRDRLICIENKSIYCCSLDGKVRWKFQHELYQDRVTIDAVGNVYMTDRYTNTLNVVTHDGKRCIKILTKLNGLNQPCGFSFDNKENALLICNIYDGKAFLFDVKMELESMKMY
ncbi:unnamed protein product [Mytilus edulis]|uniref:Uncharacterized protein n=1 Tax=Mytilus edulis TaxID=6550 RepID=A0A8S3UEB8_MYTED|nr:unnamed protein product [Mytilus edulis]